MGLGDALDKFHVGHFAKTFIMHDDIKAPEPIGIRIEAHLVFPVVAFLDDCPGDVGAGADAFRRMVFWFS